MAMTENDNNDSTTRRNFLKAVGATAAAGSVAPAVHAAKEGKAPILGTGEHTYEVVLDWGKLPKHIKFGNTHGVVEDSQHRIFIHHTGGKDTMVLFDADGKFIKSWGPQFTGTAHGITINKENGEEFLYLSPTGMHKTFKTTLDGKILWERGVPPLKDVYADPNKYVPTNIAVAPNGDFYVADGYGQSYIHQYNAKAEYLRSWGGKGSEPGKLNCPHGIWIDTRGDKPIIVVADRSNVRLQQFSLDGKHIGFVTKELRHPCHFDQRGENLLIPDLYGRVTIFDKNNELITHLGDTDKEWKKPNGYPNVPHAERVVGKFIAPHDAIWDHDGNIYVSEWVPDGRVTKLRHVS